MISVVSSSTVGSTTPEIQSLTKDLLIKIFKDKIFVVSDLATMCLVCKQWKECAQDSVVLARFKTILNKLNLNKVEISVENNDWLWIKENYYPRCEVFFDTTSLKQCCADQNGVICYPDTPNMVKTTQYALENLTELGIPVTLWPITASDHEPIFFPGQKTIAEVFQQFISKSDLPVRSPHWFILASRLSNHRFEDPRLWSKKKLIILSSGFNPHGWMPCENTLLAEIEKVATYIKERKNLHIQVLNFSKPHIDFSSNWLLNKITFRLDELNNVSYCSQNLGTDDGK